MVAGVYGTASWYILQVPQVDPSTMMQLNMKVFTTPLRYDYYLYNIHLQVLGLQLDRNMSSVAAQ